MRQTCQPKSPELGPNQRHTVGPKEHLNLRRCWMGKKDGRNWIGDGVSDFDFRFQISCSTRPSDLHPTPVSVYLCS